MLGGRATAGWVGPGPGGGLRARRRDEGELGGDGRVLVYVIFSNKHTHTATSYTTTRTHSRFNLSWIRLAGWSDGSQGRTLHTTPPPKRLVYDPYPD